MAEYDVAILGAGFGGLGLAVNLKVHTELSFVVLEQAHGVGGTWRDNVYPGAACDTESHLYCYGFAPHAEVSRAYARQPELLRYAERIVRENTLDPHIRLGARVVGAHWLADERLWSVELASGETVRARSFVAAWGQLNRPSVPQIPGLEQFNGIQFHSARWQQLDRGGQRVASIGNAASAVQYIPELAPEVGHLTVFQRSPNWVVPRGDRPYSAEELQRYADDPDLFAADRQALFTWRETQFSRMRQGSDEAREAEAMALAHLVAQVPDADLRAKLTPDYPLGCKRVLRSDDYYPALMRDNVSLVTVPIQKVVGDGIVTSDGAHHPLDVIIFGTGFETQSFQGEVEVHGVDGVDLRAIWHTGVRAHLGMTVPRFPNFFMIYGPNTNLGHNSILSMLEAQFGYLLQAIPAGLRSPCSLRPAVLDLYDRALQGRMTGSAWSGDCSSWYKDRHGRVVNNWPGTVQEYQEATRCYDPDMFTAV